MAPCLLVVQLAGELGPPCVRYRTGEPVVGQHPSHMQILDDEPVVGLDQRVRYLVCEMSARVGHVVVVTAEPGGSVSAVV
jgi:hypothetical protein